MDDNTDTDKNSKRELESKVFIVYPKNINCNKNRKRPHISIDSIVTESSLPLRKRKNVSDIRKQNEKTSSDTISLIKNLHPNKESINTGIFISSMDDKSHTVTDYLEITNPDNTTEKTESTYEGSSIIEHGDETFTVEIFQKPKANLKLRKEKFSKRRRDIYDNLQENQIVCRKLAGQFPVLSQHEEFPLVEWIRERYNSGYPIRKIDLINRAASLVDCRQNRFREGIPGEKWFMNFLLRHPCVDLMESSNRVTPNRIPSKKCINTWFKSCHEFLSECGKLNLLENPKFIGTLEEISVNLNPFGQSDYDSDSEEIGDEDGGNVEVLIGACADGSMMPTMPVFSCKKPPPALLTTVPDEWSIGLSKDGSVDKLLLFNYFKKTLIPWLELKGKLPFFLFIDKRKLQLTSDTVDLCARKGLIVHNFYPNSYHIQQPLYKFIDDIKTTFNLLARYACSKLALLNFCPNLEIALSEIATSAVIKRSFYLTGLHPFNANAIDYKKSVPVTIPKNANSFSSSRYVQALEIVEALIGRQKTEQFCQRSKNYETFIEDDDKNLFKLWDKISTECERHEDRFPDDEEYRHDKILLKGRRSLRKPFAFLKIVGDDFSTTEVGKLLSPISIQVIKKYKQGSSTKSALETNSQMFTNYMEEIDKGDDFSNCFDSNAWKMYHNINIKEVKKKTTKIKIE